MVTYNDETWAVIAADVRAALEAGYASDMNVRRATGRELLTAKLQRTWGMEQSSVNVRLRNLRRRSSLWAPIQALIDAQQAQIANREPDEAPEVVLGDAVKSRRLEQEVAALRKRERDLLDEIIRLENARETVMGLRDALGEPVPIFLEEEQPGDVQAVLHISDVHGGEHVSLHEMDGLNSYDEAICRARLHRLFQKTARILHKHQRAGERLTRLKVCLGGDMIDNNLREESRRGGAMPVVPSIQMVAEAIAPGLTFLHEEFGLAIDVFTSPGNHGRLTPKPHSTEGNIDNLDILVSWGIEKLLREPEWAQFHYTGSGEVIFNCFGWKFLLRHGHEGASGTGGMYGPVYKQVRGMYKAHTSYGRRNRPFHFVLQGHDHTSSKLPFGFANSSVVGYTPYAMRKLMADPSPASQNLLIVNREHGVIAHHELYLGVPSEGSLYETPE